MRNQAIRKLQHCRTKDKEIGLLKEAGVGKEGEMSKLNADVCNLNTLVKELKEENKLLKGIDEESKQQISSLNIKIDCLEELNKELRVQINHISENEKKSDLSQIDQYSTNSRQVEDLAQRTLEEEENTLEPEGTSKVEGDSLAKEEYNPVIIKEEGGDLVQEFSKKAQNPDTKDTMSTEISPEEVNKLREENKELKSEIEVQRKIITSMMKKIESTHCLQVKYAQETMQYSKQVAELKKKIKKSQ
eukprot:TRINITY_DN15860_c0_g1_i1.p1 TRINITY_DN15860_c0_g1~~TRINITY_DN15860_c0_g1_i1.p1  ORF type:complete len:246 (-),score=89.03 TRINITY_DN15860_c0_g1_i1:62-799(-)